MPSKLICHASTHATHKIILHIIKGLYNFSKRQGLQNSTYTRVYTVCISADLHVQPSASNFLEKRKDVMTTRELNIIQLMTDIFGIHFLSAFFFSFQSGISRLQRESRDRDRERESYTTITTTTKKPSTSSEKNEFRQTSTMSMDTKMSVEHWHKLSVTVYTWQHLDKDSPDFHV